MLTGGFGGDGGTRWGRRLRVWVTCVYLVIDYIVEIKMETYILHELLNLGSIRVFTLGGNSEIDFLPGGGLDIVPQVDEVGGRLKINFTVVFIHCGVFVHGGFVGAAVSLRINGGKGLQGFVTCAISKVSVVASRYVNCGVLCRSFDSRLTLAKATNVYILTRVVSRFLSE